MKTMLDSVRLPSSAVLPGVTGLRGPLSCLTEARFGIAWGVTGAARTCLETAVSYATTRTQFGKPIGGFQLTQSKLAWMAVSLVFVFSYLTIRRMSGRFSGILFSLPLAVFFAFNENNEFQHYSSELVSAVLLTASMFLVPLATEGRSGALLWRSLGCGLLLGGVPFAKLQAVPMAFVIGAPLKRHW
mgnify:CR=1 FL=1